MKQRDLRALKPYAERLEPKIRQSIASAWLSAALDEHASIAAFSRFSLHLIALGAPPQLLGAAHQAALDELEHTKLCFAVYEVYAGEPAAPSPLHLPRDLLGPLTPEAIVGAAVAEGCVGETIAAHEAGQLAERCEIEALQMVLKQIAQDEQKHAELAWRFVTWALSKYGRSVRDAVVDAFAATCVADDQVYSMHTEEIAHIAHGVATPKLKSTLRAAAIAEVIAPLREALLMR